MGIAQLRSPPCNVEDWRMMGPSPLARTMHRIKNVPAIGVTMGLEGEEVPSDRTNVNHNADGEHWERG
jgi:hypothetical protein